MKLNCSIANEMIDINKINYHYKNHTLRLQYLQQPQSSKLKCKGYTAPNSESEKYMGIALKGNVVCVMFDAWL